jgi:hypothetical protein
VLDAELRAQFISRAFRKMWRLPDAKADSKPAFVALMYHGRDTRAYDVPESKLDAYVARRAPTSPVQGECPARALYSVAALAARFARQRGVAYVKSGNPAPIHVRLASGDVIRFQCTVLPGGGRMLTYTDVSDIARGAA